MKDKLTIFRETEIHDKEELLICLRDLFVEYSCDDSISHTRISLLMDFIKAIESTNLPKCDDWWFYSYNFSRFGMTLDMCHCAEFDVDDKDKSKMTVDESFPIIRTTCKMMTISEFAQLNKVKPVAVRQWIRRGKLRAIKKQGRDWLVASIADKPSRRYIPVSYSWSVIPEELYEHFPFLKGVYSINISQDKTDKSTFIVEFEINRKIMIGAADCEKLELALLSIDNIEVEEDSLFAPFTVEEENHDDKFKFDSRVEPTDYGPVVIVSGPHKGRIGIYDDEDTEDGQTLAIVYFGNMLLPSAYELIPYEYLSSALTTYKLVERINEISRELCKRKKDVYFQNERLHELYLCSNLLEDRYINARERMKMKENHNIFISHASQDLHIARALATDLINNGFSVFLDDWSVDLGENIISRISDAIDESHSLIMLISSDYLRSTYCSDEWTSFYMRYSKTKKNSIYPILVDESEPPAILSAIKYARINDMENYQEVYAQLLSAIRKRCNL